MNHLWSLWATPAICLSCAVVQLYWGGQDKEGQFHADYLVANGNLGVSLFFLGPYLLLAVSTLVAGRQRANVGRFVLVAVLCAIGLLAGWVDHDQYLRMPPGRETPQLLNFLATLGLWPSSVVLLAAIAWDRAFRQPPAGLAT